MLLSTPSPPGELVLFYSLKRKLSVFEKDILKHNPESIFFKSLHGGYYSFGAVICFKSEVRSCKNSSFSLRNEQIICCVASSSPYYWIIGEYTPTLIELFVKVKGFNPKLSKEFFAIGRFPSSIGASNDSYNVCLDSKTLTNQRYLKFQHAIPLSHPFCIFEL